MQQLGVGIDEPDLDRGRLFRAVFSRLLVDATADRELDSGPRRGEKNVETADDDEGYEVRVGRGVEIPLRAIHPLR